MAKEIYGLSKQNSQQCYSQLSNFESVQQVNDANKWEDILQSRQDLMKKYLFSKSKETQVISNVNQSQKVFAPSNQVAEQKFIKKTNEVKIKTREKENIGYQQYQQQIQKTIIPNALENRKKSVYDRLYNLRTTVDRKDSHKDCNGPLQLDLRSKQSNHNVLLEKRSSDPQVLMPLSSLIWKSQQKQQQNLQQEMQKHFLDQSNEKVHSKFIIEMKQNSQTDNHNSQLDFINQLPVKQCFFSLLSDQGKKKNCKVRSLSTEKIKSLPKSKPTKGTRAHTSGKSESKHVNKINKLYEYILEGNY